MTSRNSTAWIGFGAFALALGAGALFLATSLSAGPKGIPLGSEEVASTAGANQNPNGAVIVKQGWEYTRAPISGGGTGNTGTPTSDTIIFNGVTYVKYVCTSCTGVHNNNGSWWWSPTQQPIPDCVIYNTTPCP